MDGDGIFLIRDDHSLVVLNRQPYESEALLQEALELFPEVIAGGTTADGDRRGLLLIRREMGIPKDDGASPTWSIDHLFVDGDGVPVLVEVKRSSDTRIRREVVGQMLDYAANGIRYWPVAELRDAFEARCLLNGTTADDQLLQVFPEADPDEFWQKVGDNLAAGRIRMVFVADRLPAELIRIIEFLDEQMQPAQVLGVEMPQYVGEGHQLLVPKLVGRTVKSSPIGRQWTEERILDTCTATLDPNTAAVVKRLLAHAHQLGDRVNLGKAQSAGMSAWYNVAGKPTYVWKATIAVAPDQPGASLFFYFPLLREKLGLAAYAHFVELLTKVKSYPKLNEALPEGAKKYPSVNLVKLAASPGDLERLLEAIESIVSEQDKAWGHRGDSLASESSA